MYIARSQPFVKAGLVIDDDDGHQKKEDQKAVDGTEGSSSRMAEKTEEFERRSPFTAP